MKNDCSIVRDLLPLYVEDMVSKDTAEFVDEHLKDCIGCNEELKMLKEGSVKETENEITEAEKAKAKSFKKIMKKLNIRYDVLGSMLIVFATLFSMVLSNSNDMFYNILLMPMVGVCGYCLFSIKAFYKTPLLIAITNLFAFGIKLVNSESIWFTVFYIILSAVGVAIALLFHLTFKKSKIKNRAGKIILKVSALCTALALTGFISFFGFALVGNPISVILAKKGAEDYLAQAYPGTDYVVTDVGHDFKNGGYYAHVESPSSEDIWFVLSIDGKGYVVYDNYDMYVGDGFTTRVRLRQEYEEMVQDVISSKAFPCKVDWGYGHVGGLDNKKFEVDGIYNVNELAKETGEIDLRVYDDDLSYERMAEMLLDVKEAFDKAGVSFNTINFTIIHESDKEIYDRPSVDVDNIKYEDITEEGLTELLGKMAEKQRIEREESIQRKKNEVIIGGADGPVV